MVWRYVLAGLLSMLVFVTWLKLFPPPPLPPQRVQVPAAEAPAKVASVPEGVQAAVPALPDAPRLPLRERKEIPIAIGGPFEYVADSSGGCLARISLPEFHESVERKEPYTLLQSPPGAPGTFALEVEDPANPARPSRIPVEENWDLERVPAGDASPAVVFKYELDGIAITKTVSAGGREFPGAGSEDAAARHLKVSLEIQNRGPEARELTYRLYGPVGVDTEDLQTAGSDIELAFGTRGRGEAVQVEVLSAAKITHKDITGGGVAWVGVSNNYFTSIFFPLPSDAGHPPTFVEKAFADAYPDAQSLDALAREKHGRPFEQVNPQDAAAIREKAYKNLRVAFRSVRVALPPGGAAVKHEYGLYVGPRDREILDRYAALNFQGVNQHGTFGFLVKFFMWLLGILKTVAFGSWGVAIVLLTFVVKVCLHPINKRTQAGMQRFQKQMQKIKPQMDEIKEKYAQNRVRMNQEIQKLWKENHVSPGQQMAGCLIMLLQLPIWYGLYSTLRYAIGLRQASFLYISDLTRPDMLLNFGFSLPFIGDWFNLLPVLYVILTIVNQRLQPKPEDPQMLQQYRMMTFMMVFFGFIFYSFPAGFMLYIMTSAALGILESKIIKAELKHEENRANASLAPAVAGARGSTGAIYPARSRKAEEEKLKRGSRG